MHRIRLATFVIVSLSAAIAAGQPKQQNLVQAALLSDARVVKPGEPFQVGLHLKISPKWHVYWINSGDAGLPTTFKLTLPAGYTASAVRYPIPTRFVEAGGIVVYGYTDEVMLLATVTPPDKLESSSVRIGADSNWLVCEKTCIPGQAKLELELAVGAASTPSDHKELFAKWVSHLPAEAAKSDQIAEVTQDMTLRAAEAGKQSGELAITVNWKSDAPASVEWFPPPADGVFFSSIRSETKGKATVIRAAFERYGLSKPVPKWVDSVVAYDSTGRSGLSVPVDLSKLNKTE
jgi:DsbC/DsbD-like thiol-disulfide interchange protein